MGSSSAAPLDFYLTSDTFACDLALNGETSVGRVQLGGDGSAFAYVSRVQCVVAPDGDGGVILTSRGGNPTLVRPRWDDKWLQVHPAGAVHHLMPGDAVAHCGVTCEPSLNARLLWQNTQFTPWAFDM